MDCSSTLNSILLRSFPISSVWSGLVDFTFQQIIVGLQIDKISLLLSISQIQAANIVTREGRAISGNPQVTPTKRFLSTIGYEILRFLTFNVAVNSAGAVSHCGSKEHRLHKATTFNIINLETKSPSTCIANPLLSVAGAVVNRQLRCGASAVSQRIKAAK